MRLSGEGYERLGSTRGSRKSKVNPTCPLQLDNGVGTGFVRTCVQKQTVQPGATTFHWGRQPAPTCANLRQPTPRSCEFALSSRLLILLFAALRLFVSPCIRRVCLFCVADVTHPPNIHLQPPTSIDLSPISAVPARSPASVRSRAHAPAALALPPAVELVWERNIVVRRCPHSHRSLSLLISSSFPLVFRIHHHAPTFRPCFV